MGLWDTGACSWYDTLLSQCSKGNEVNVMILVENTNNTAAWCFDVMSSPQTTSCLIMNSLQMGPEELVLGPFLSPNLPQLGRFFRAKVTHLVTPNEVLTAHKRVGGWVCLCISVFPLGFFSAAGAASVYRGLDGRFYFYSQWIQLPAECK